MTYSAARAERLRGYRRAGFGEIVGIDNAEQPNYPYDFIKADALEYAAEAGRDFDAIHASPPCQGYSVMIGLPWLRDREYPLLILPTLEILSEIGRPYVLENVMGAQHGHKGLKRRGLEAHGLQAGWLCGAMFGLPFYRHRLFAANWLWLAPPHPRHPPARTNTGETFRDSAGKLHPEYRRVNTAWRVTHDGGTRRLNDRRPDSEIGHQSGWRIAAEAMEIDWMTRDELTQAIPPAFTEYIGRQLIRAVETWP